MELKIIANSPIAHGAFSDGIGTGNLMEFRRVPVMINNKVVKIPTISGNAVRGVIRRILAREFFEENHINEVLEPKKADRLYAIIGNGGTLGKDLAKDVKCEYLRELRVQLPLLSVLGAACYKYMVNGMVNVGFFKLDCLELGNSPIRADEQIIEIGETRHVNKNIINSEEQEITPMPYLTEAVNEGASFSGTINFTPMTTEVEKSCFIHGIKLISHLGGKSARGYGQVKMVSEEPLDDSLYLKSIKNIDIDFIQEFVESTLWFIKSHFIWKVL